MSDDALRRLERQIERGSFFLHTEVSRNAEDIHETQSLLFGAIDVLVASGLLKEEEILEAARKVRTQMDAQGRTTAPNIALRVDAPLAAGQPEFVAVNCAERLPVCKAICCRLHFALTAEEVEKGAVKWDMGRPYSIRQESDGSCTHMIGGNCSVYADRPGICRRYSCATDTRIWSDFENMVLNEEWIAEHLKGDRPRLVATQMVPAAT